MTRSRRMALLAVGLSLALVAACGGSDGSDDTTGGGATDTTRSPDSTADGGPGSGGDFTPGDVTYRMVNLLDVPVDVYARTGQGLVEAFLVKAGLAPGEVLEAVAPPADGKVVVLEAGAGDPECVSTCPHILTEAAAQPQDGKAHTVVLHDDAGTARGMVLWEDPVDRDATTANALPAADPATGTLIVNAVAVEEADFGLRLAFAGAAGCQEPAGSANVLVGGNQTLAFPHGDDVSVVLHDNRDTDCSAETVGGPFAVSGGAGSRTLLILHGRPGNLAALIIPLGGSGGSGGGDGGPATGDDADLVAELSTFLQGVVDGLPADAADCLARQVVDGVGADRIRAEVGASGAWADIGGPLADEMEEALGAGFAACGVDPEDYG